MTGTVTVQDAGADPLEDVLVFSETAGFRMTRSTRASRRSRRSARPTTSASLPPRTPPSSTPPTSPCSTPSSFSTTGDVLTAEQQDAFEDYIRAGGGFVGIHAAADTEYTWPWYGEMIGGYFRNHPPDTPTATVNINDPDEPSTEGLPAAWTRTDEWYNYQSFETPSVNGGGDDYNVADSGVKVLASVDESTYVEEDGSDGTNDPHPIAWCSDFDGGRVWYTGMGQRPSRSAPARATSASTSSAGSRPSPGPRKPTR